MGLNGMSLEMCAGTVSVKSWTYFGTFLILISSFYNPRVEGEHQVIGPSHVILAKAGEDVVLPCHIEPPINAAKKTMEWSRPGLKPEYVHVLQQGHDMSHFKNPQYKQRTSLFVEELPHGNISLKLSSVQLSDEGSFRCFVPTLHSSSLIQLRVGAVSQPVILNGPKDDGLCLTCDSGCWYPEPEVSWLDSGGNLLPAEPSVTVRHSGHCYAVQRNVTVRRAGNVTCRVHLPHINHTVEIHTAIPDHNSTQSTGNVNSTQPTSDTVLILSVFGSVIFIGNVFAIVGIVYHLRRKKAGTSNGSEENGDVMEKGSMLGQRKD